LKIRIVETGEIVNAKRFNDLTDVEYKQNALSKAAFGNDIFTEPKEIGVHWECNYKEIEILTLTKEEEDAIDLDIMITRLREDI